MKKPLLLGTLLAVLLVALAVSLPSLRARFLGEAEPAPPAPLASPTGAASPPASPRATPTAAPVSPSPSPREPSPSPSPALQLVGRPRVDAQIREVVESMDRTGRPPAGVVQGGRRGGRRGVFVNAERRLPVKPAGYYRESDVWPSRGSPRGAERLVFGRNREVYYSPDHYRTFQRLR